MMDRKGVENQNLIKKKGGGSFRFFFFFYVEFAKLWKILICGSTMINLSW